MRTYASVVLVAFTFVAACGGSGDGSQSSPTAVTSPTLGSSDTSNPIIGSSSSSNPPTSDGQSAVDDVPAGWVESISRFDTAVGEFVESSDDSRFTSFLWIAEGCCDAGLNAPFGSPEFPVSDEAADLGDGLYVARIVGWSPSEPDRLEMEVRRVVDCDSEEAVDIYYCELYDFQPGRYESLETARSFRFRLDESFSIRLSATLEPVDDDEYYTNYSWIGQGPEFSRLLVDLYSTYSDLVTRPFESGVSLDDIDVSLNTSSDFRRVDLGENFMPFGLWRTPDGPAVTFNVTDGLIPACYSEQTCIDGGDPRTTPASFGSLIGTPAGLHVVGGRSAFLLLGAQLGG